MAVLHARSLPDHAALFSDGDVAALRKGDGKHDESANKGLHLGLLLENDFNVASRAFSRESAGASFPGAFVQKRGLVVHPGGKYFTGQGGCMHPLGTRIPR